MKLFRSILTLALCMATFMAPSRAEAQYYEIANQIPQLLRPALSGSMNYKGFFDAGYNKTFGNYVADFAEFSTTQGFQYANWMYMGVGLGVDVIFAHRGDNWGNWDRSNNFDFNHSSTSKAVMMPLFTDFRFTLGNSTGASFFLDLRLGCSFLLGKDYIEIGNGYLTNQQYFYLRPSLGIRIPVSDKSSKQAVDLGITYKLLTSNYWNSWNRSITLNGIGVSIGYEW